METERECRDALARLSAHFSLVLSDEQLTQLLQYARMVMRWRTITNLTAAATELAFINAHIADSLAVIPHMEAGRWLDAGSGAGLPGMVAAIAEPRLEMILVEPRERRSRFLRQVVIELELANVEIECVRLEALRLPGAVAGIVSRAFGSLSEFVEAASSACTGNTRLVAMKGQVDEVDLAAAATVAGPAQVIELDVPTFSNRHVVIFERC